MASNVAARLSVAVLRCNDDAGHEFQLDHLGGGWSRWCRRQGGFRPVQPGTALATGGPAPVRLYQAGVVGPVPDSRDGARKRGCRQRASVEFDAGDTRSLGGQESARRLPRTIDDLRREGEKCVAAYTAEVQALSDLLDVARAIDLLGSPPSGSWPVRSRPAR
jgi:hypothetical protein